MVTEPASHEAAGEAVGAPKRSRRAIRAAEREAEREALLTGQQPLLTRKELRRLREEAQALQAAIAAGEITLEQAKALQDPLAEAPNIDVPALHATGTHAAVRADEDAQPAPTQEAPDAKAAAHDAATESKETPATEAAVPGQDAQAQPEEQPAQEAPQAKGQVSSQTDARGSVEHHRDFSDEEKAAIAEAPTGVMNAADIPAAKPTTPAPPVAPAIPDRRSVFAQAATPAAGTSVPTTATPTTPTRKPIVRIPAAAQGVRTVNSETGELSAVKVMDESFESIETPQWKALRADAATSADKAVESDQDAVEAAQQDGSHKQAETKAAAKTVAQADAKPEAFVVPGDHQWAPLSAASAMSGSSATSANSAQTPDTADDNTARDGEHPHHSHAAGQRENAGKPQKDTHHLLTALVVFVILLVVATLAWFYLGKANNSAAADAVWQLHNWVVLRS